MNLKNKSNKIKLRQILDQTSLEDPELAFFDIKEKSQYKLNQLNKFYQIIEKSF